VQANFPEDPVQPDVVVLDAPAVEELDDGGFVNGLVKTFNQANGLIRLQRPWGCAAHIANMAIRTTIWKKKVFIFLHEQHEYVHLVYCFLSKTHINVIYSYEIYQTVLCFYVLMCCLFSVWLSWTLPIWLWWRWVSIQCVSSPFCCW